MNWNLTEAQYVCLLFALPFLTLSCAWLIGLSLLFKTEQRRIPVRIRKDRDNG